MSFYKPHSIGYVTRRYPCFSETFIVNEIVALERKGVRIEIFSVYPPIDVKVQDVIAHVRSPVTYLPAAAPSADEFWRTMQRAAALLKRTRVELAEFEPNRHTTLEIYQSLVLSLAVAERGISHLHAHFASAPTTIARLAARISGVSYTFTAHAKDIYLDNIDRDLWRQKVADASGVVTVSEFNRRYIRSNFGGTAHRVILINNGVDLTRFRYRAPRKRLPLIVAAGRLVEKKGFSILLEACAILRQKRVVYSCEIIGDGELRPELSRLARRLHLGRRVRLVGALPQCALIPRIQRAAVFAAPCVIGRDGNRDGLPTVLIETMALGTPCVSTRVTGIPELVQDGLTGLLVEPGNAASLAESLGRLLHNGELRVRLAQAARRTVEHNYESARNVELLRALWNRAMGSRRRHRCT